VPLMPELVPHEGGVASFRKQGHSYYLAHKLTREIYQLQRPGTWHLYINEDKFAYLSNGEESLWVEDCLRIGCYSSGSGYLVVLEPGSAATPLGDFQAQGDLTAKFTVDVPPRRPISIRCVWWLAQRAGAHVWWDLSSVYESLQLQSFTYYGIWASHGWTRWQKWASEQVGLPESHFVKAGKGVLEEGADMADCRTASSIAMVGLLARWAVCQAPGGGGRCD